MTQRSTNGKLGALLRKGGLIEEAALEAALGECASRSVGLATVLVEGGALGEQELLQAVGTAMKLPTLDLRGLAVDPEAARLVPHEFARRNRVLALGWTGGFLRVAVSDPFDVVLLDDLRLLTGRPIQPVFVYEGALAQVLDALGALEREASTVLSDDLGAEPDLPQAEPEPEPEPTPAPVRVEHAPPRGRSMPAAADPREETAVHAPPSGEGAARAESPALPEGARALVEVFYATDRHQRLLRRKPEGRFSGARNRSGALRFGLCDVSIPMRHTTGRLERPAWYRLEFRERTSKHVVITDLKERTTREFYESLRLRIGASPQRAALVFVHGYNVSFGDAVRRTAQLAYDLEFEGAPITYSWPSRGKLSGYLTDENNVAWSAPHLEGFLLAVRELTGAETVHLIAHSMGSRALTEALTRIAARPRSATRADFRQVVLAAPDIDADVFRDLAPRFAANAQRVTLYASSKDEALKVSGRLHGGYARAGQTEPEVVVVQGVDTIDASAVGTGLGHSYYGDEPSIVSDLFYLLRRDTPPGERHRMEPRRSRELVYWALRG